MEKLLVSVQSVIEKYILISLFIVQLQFVNEISGFSRNLSMNQAIWC